MYTILVIVQVLVAVALIGLILLQQGKGADAGAAFGSGASGTVFGSRGSANFLSRTTAWLAAVFFVASLALGYVLHGRSSGGSIVERAATAAPAPATPAPANAAPPAAAVPAQQPAAPAAAPQQPQVTVPPEQPAKPAPAPVKVPE
jgi:preprotein translocase subunit SecG